MKVLSVFESEKLCKTICNKFIANELEVSDENIKLELVNFVEEEEVITHLVSVIKSLIVIYS